MNNTEKYTLEEEVRDELSNVMVGLINVKSRVFRLWKAFSDYTLIEDENERTQLKSFKSST